KLWSAVTCHRFSPLEQTHLSNEKRRSRLVGTALQKKTLHLNAKCCGSSSRYAIPNWKSHRLRCVDLGGWFYLGQYCLHHALAEEHSSDSLFFIEPCDQFSHHRAL